MNMRYAMSFLLLMFVNILLMSCAGDDHPNEPVNTDPPPVVLGIDASSDYSQTEQPEETTNIISAYATDDRYLDFNMGDLDDANLSFEYIKNMYEGYAGVLSHICIKKSRVRDGYYVVVDYSAIEEEAFYYEESKGFVPLAMGGLPGLFSVREVTLSQGEFLEDFRPGRNGTGGVRFYENSEDMTLSYDVFELLIDRNAEGLYYEELPYLISDELKAELNEGDRISWVYANGRLDAEYADFNNDGHTDMRFYGIRKTMVDKDEDSLLVVAEEFYMMIFLFDPESNEFVLDREEVIPLNTTEDYLFSCWG